MSKVLFVVNNPDFFLSHRLPLAEAARKAGYEIHVATPVSPSVDRILERGFEFHPIPMQRSRGLVWQEAATLYRLYRLYARLKPGLVHQVTIKPVLYGTLAARLARVPAVFNAISGLGFVFIAGGVFSRIRRAMVVGAYRFSLRHPRQKIIFQNPDDAEIFLSARIVTRRDIGFIRGSGADPELYRASPEPEGEPVVLFPARMLRDKGVGELISAARILLGEGRRFRLWLAGDVDAGNPASLDGPSLRRLHSEGVAEWLGHCRDMPALFRACHIVCLPSYREGLPKALVEAAASGRPIVTTDVPGCREVVADGENGLLVPSRDAASLARALGRLLSDAPLRRSMGDCGRRRFEAEFSLDRVVADTLFYYRELIGTSTPDGSSSGISGSRFPQE